MLPAFIDRLLLCVVWLAPLVVPLCAKGGGARTPVRCIRCFRPPRMACLGGIRSGCSTGPDRWNEPGVRLGSQDSVWYEVPFICPAGWTADGRRVIPDFERIEGEAIIFVDGRRAAELLAPDGEIEIISLVAPEGGATTLRIFNSRTYAGMPRGFEQDILRHVARTGREALLSKTWPRGITAPVTLRSRPTQAVTDVGPKFDPHGHPRLAQGRTCAEPFPAL